MKVVPISTRLSEFGIDRNTPLEPEGVAVATDDFGDQTSERKPTEHALLEQYESGLAEGKKQGQAEAALRFQAQVEQMTGDFQVQLDGVQTALGEELKQVVEKRLEQLETDLSDTVAGILRPFLPGLLKRQILSQFKQLLSELMSDPRDPMIAISGPAFLLAGLKKSFSDSDAPLMFVENDETEIVVEVGLTKIASKFQCWSEMINAEVQ